MAKKDRKGTENPDKSGQKKTITVKIPSVGNPMAVLTVVLLVLLALSVLYNVKLAKGAKTDVNATGLMYICPTGQCDTKDIDEWSSGIGVSAKGYEADWARSPIGLYLEGSKVAIVDVSSKANYYTTMCEGTNLEAACTESKAAATETQKSACESVKKVDEPVLEAFVVSYCPYGLQMQRVLTEVQKTIGKDVDIKVRYIGAVVDGKITSMHGEQEATENHRQICMREEQASKYWDYISCFIKAGETDPCLDEAKIDKAKLTSCMSDANKGLKYAQVDFDGQNKYGVSGSPTLILNGEKASEFDFGGRSVQGVGSMLCCSMNKRSSGCDIQVSTDQAATGFSQTYSAGGGSTGAAASCG
ncbi:hypothetical protein A3K63_00205 [Candidatus Micrarchaeota archaeon RBG_16_49_10]|nr:MAG: hypothetical protein A3K63_00205 [Candidatus Micrarchaeota archaeon RBG_16_49_10]